MRGSLLLRLLTGFSLIGVLLVGSIRQSAFQPEWYTDFYQEIHLARTLDVSQSDLDKAITILVEYVQGTRESLDGTMMLDGKEVEIYNQKEKEHMVDVRSLWKKAATVGDQLFILFLFLCFYWLLVGKQRSLYLGIMQGYGVFALFLAGLGFWMVADFNSFWTMFHHVFFSNNLWLLDPATDFMIRICPESMFFALIMRILLCFSLASLAALLVCFIAWKKSGKTKNRIQKT